MCLSCEMAMRWFAEMEKAAQPADAPNHNPANADVAVADDARREPQNPAPAAYSAGRNGAAPGRNFSCEPASGEGE